VEIVRIEIPSTARSTSISITAGDAALAHWQRSAVGTKPGCEDRWKRPFIDVLAPLGRVVEMSSDYRCRSLRRTTQAWGLNLRLGQVCPFGIGQEHMFGRGAGLI
jgi:hypothetical protein